VLAGCQSDLAERFAGSGGPVGPGGTIDGGTPGPSSPIEPGPETPGEPEPMSTEPGTEPEPAPVSSPEPATPFNGDSGGGPNEPVGGAAGTAPIPDGFAVATSTPEAGATEIDPATDLVLEFTERIVPGPGAVSLSDANGLVETIGSGDPRVEVIGRNARIDLDAILASATDHTLTVATDAFLSAAGVALDEEATFTFETAAVALPGDVADGLALWLDAAYPESLKGGDVIELWADRSGGHRNAVQPEATQQPDFEATGLNEKPAISFDGRDDFLVAPVPGGMAAFEGFVVWETMLAPGNATTLLLHSPGKLELSHGHVSPTSRRSVSVFAGTEWVSAAYRTPPMNAPTLWGLAVSDETNGVYARSQGGAPVFAPFSEPAGELMDPLSIGAGEDGADALLVRIAEIVLYDRVLSSDERTFVTSYLRAKWAFAAPACAVGQSLGPDGSCYFVTPDTASWDAAEASCGDLGLGWHLASVRSEAEGSFLAGLLTEPAWTSGTSGAESLWSWADDGALFWSGGADGSPEGNAYANWASDQPSGTGCLRLAASGEWEAADCTDPHPAACQGPGN
jgi:hypothetical protein